MSPLVQKQKLLFVLQLPPPVHGVSTINEIILEQFNNNPAYQIELVQLKFANKFDAIRRINFLKFIRFYRIYFKIKQTVQYFKPDLVYFSFMPVGMGFLRDYCYLNLIKKYPVKIILHVHNLGIKRYSTRPLFKYLYKKTFSNLTLIHLSDHLIREELQNLFLKNCKTYAIANICRPFINKRISSYKKNINVLYFSNIFPEKGYEIALEAMKRIVKIHSDVILKLYGQSLRRKYEKDILKFIRKNDLKQHIFYKGPAFGDQKEKAFLEADIFIFPSYFSEECFPLAILEAMQAGLAIIASKVGALETIIQNNNTGLLIIPQSVSDLVNNLNLLITEPELLKRLGNAAKNAFEENYLIQEFYRQINSAIKNTLND